MESMIKSKIPWVRDVAADSEPKDYCELKTRTALEKINNKKH